MYKELQESLLADETILWSAESVQRSARERTFRKIRHFAWLVGGAIAVPAVLMGGHSLIEGDYRVFSQVIAAIILLAEFFGIIALFSNPGAAAYVPEHYAITDRRILIIRSDGQRISITRGWPLHIWTRKNAAYHEFSLSFGEENMYDHTFRLRDDPKEAEHLILTYFGKGKEAS